MPHILTLSTAWGLFINKKKWKIKNYFLNEFFLSGISPFSSLQFLPVPLFSKYEKFIYKKKTFFISTAPVPFVFDVLSRLIKKIKSIKEKIFFSEIRAFTKPRF